MRYLLPLLFTFTFACGEDSARPRNKQDQEADLGVDMSEVSDMGMDNGVEDMGCNNVLDCMSDEDIQDKLLNLLHPMDHEDFKGHYEFEPQPFEFNQEEDDEDQKG